ncbi:MAG: acetyl-CoA carboxylase carboxyltransferase subunit alpha [Nitrospinae bacterium]|nr:acetyl-CoA carboxylase carboxyltransferase subunit alpha [Nitrospinota bacterium]
MIVQILDFERPIFEIEQKIEELVELSQKGDIDFSEEIKRLKKKVKRIRKDTFSNLSSWQKTQLARHPDRPYTLDYIRLMMSDFIELHGDRGFADGNSIVGGLARLEGESIVVIGHQKGRDIKEKVFRNFGMSNPEGYRKALRLMKLANKFGKPIITMLDTPGAYPGIGAEERGQAEAIARNLKEMYRLSVPVIVVIIGEGGSGGALALGIGNRILMLENAIYSVISPEGCAAILWNNGKNVEDAAKALCLTSHDLLRLKVIDEIIKEPPSVAHRDPKMMTSILRRALRRNLKELKPLSPDELIQQRYEKFRGMGEFMDGRG